MEYKTNNDVTYLCKYHVVWCSKYRRKVLIEQVKARLKELVIETCCELNIDIIELEILPDHVVLLLGVEPQLSVHKVVKQIKRVSSSSLRTEFLDLKTRLPTLWSNSYFVSTIGLANIEDINKYILSQKTSQRG